MPFVLDASIVASWFMPDESHPVAEAALTRIEQDDNALVPPIWWDEVRNALVSGERRGRLDVAVTNRALAHLEGFRILVDDQGHNDTLMGLARTHGLSVYDAAYLELAQRMSLTLATLDAALARAAMATRVPLLDADQTN